MTVQSSILCGAVLVLISLARVVDSTHVCIRYGIANKYPCSGIPEVTREAAMIVPEVVGDLRTEYCRLACSEDQNYKFERMCGCPTTTLPPTTPEPTTTPAPTTTPCVTSYFEQVACDNNRATSFNIQTCDCPVKQQTPPDACDLETADLLLCAVLQSFGDIDSNVQCSCYERVCYYSRVRDNHGKKRRKRINEGTPATFCEYPGILGVFVDIGTSTRVSCTGILVDESRILVDKTCKELLSSSTTAGKAILVSSTYNVSDATTEIQLDISRIQPVSDFASNELFFVELKKNLTLDSECVLPACLPNSRFSSSDIDFDNCRVVGYGATTDDYLGPWPDTLQEVQVSVDTDSLNSPNGLNVTRKDNSVNSNVACYHDNSAPVMCAHSDTSEWIVVGLYTRPGFVCTTATIGDPIVANLLQENTNVDYYSILSNTRYAKS